MAAERGNTFGGQYRPAISLVNRNAGSWGIGSTMPVRESRRNRSPNCNAHRAEWRHGAPGDACDNGRLQQRAYSFTAPRPGGHFQQSTISTRRTDSPDRALTVASRSMTLRGFKPPSNDDPDG
ncbi:hypothetical protein ACVBGC_03470 [Burkholderia stagnalis]